MKNISSQPDLSFIAAKSLSQDEAFALVLNNFGDPFLLLDKNLFIVVTNEACKLKFKEYLGVEMSKGTCVFEFVPPERHAYLKELYEAVLNGETRTSEIAIPINETLHCFEGFYKPALNETGTVVGVIITIRDVTETKQSELALRTSREKLKLSEQHYKTLFQNNPLPCWIFDVHTLQFLEVNAAAISNYGYSKEEFLNLTILDIQHPDNIGELKRMAAIPRPQNTYFLNDWKHRTKDGSIIFVDLRINIINYHGRAAKMVVAHDVTDKVATENELRKSNERFRLAALASSEALWEWDELTQEAFVSSAYTDMLGWKAEDFRKFDQWSDYIHPDDRSETVKTYLEAIENKKTDKWIKEYRYLKSDGSYAFVHDKAIILRNEEGKAIKVVGALQNIDVQKKTEEELKKSNERFLLSSRAASDAIYEWDITSNELYWGEGLQSLFGYQPREVNMEVWESLVHPDERKKTVRHLTETLSHPRKKIWIQEYRFAKADGSYRYVLERGFIVRDDQGKPLRMIGSLQDITDRKFQERLLALERSIFELSANPDIELKEVVHTVLKGIEEIRPGAIGTVVLLKEDQSMKVLAAPSLPVEFSQAVDGLKIGPDAGSCGAAMWWKKIIITSDIEIDPVWTKHKSLARKYQLKACWSLPIVHTSGKLIGCFAIYHPTARIPGPAELSTIERLRNILRIVMENRWSLHEIKTANERFDIVMRATHDLIWDWNLETNLIYHDAAGLENVYGVKDPASVKYFEHWKQRIHPEDLPRVEKATTNMLRNPFATNFDVEYRFKRDDGSYTYVYDRGIIIRNENGEAVRAIGAAQDVSERKRLEKELISHELEHQKAINRATIETQELERTEIGKELHDNVNQVLTTTKLYLDLARSNPELKDELIEKSSKNIINVINEIRQLSRSLMDPSIEDLGLADSINDLIENINLTRKLHVSLNADPIMEEILDQNQKLTVFRIIQEALNNAIKHAE